MSSRQEIRPFAVTLTCTLLFFNALMACSNAMLSISRDIRDHSTPWASACILISTALYALVGFFMLRGTNWSRILFFALCLPLLIVDLVVFSRGIALIPCVIILAVCGLRLLSRPANRFFTGRETVFKETVSRRPRKAAQSRSHVQTTTHTRRGTRFDY